MSSRMLLLRKSLKRNLPTESAHHHSLLSMLKTTAIVLALALGASAFTPAQRPINARVRALRAEEGEETAAAPAPAPAPAAPAKKEESPYASPKGANFDKKTTGFSYGALILLLRQPAHDALQSVSHFLVESAPPLPQAIFRRWPRSRTPSSERSRAWRPPACGTPSRRTRARRGCPRRTCSSSPR